MIAESTIRNVLFFLQAHTQRAIFGLRVRPRCAVDAIEMRGASISTTELELRDSWGKEWNPLWPPNSVEIAQTSSLENDAKNIL